jgi:hypothetical protein
MIKLLLNIWYVNRRVRLLINTAMINDTNQSETIFKSSKVNFLDWSRKWKQ